MASSSSDGASLSRRRLLLGAAWAAPAIVVATAAPSAAAFTGGGTAPDVTGDVLVLSALNAQGNQGTGKLAATMSFYYQFGNWPGANWSDVSGLESVSVTWLFEVFPTAGGATVFSDGGASVLYYNASLGPQSVAKTWSPPAISGLAAGNYSVRLTVTATSQVHNGLVYKANDIVSTVAATPAVT